MSLNSAIKGWFATNAGTSNCFAASGITYTDADGLPHTGRTGDIANAYYTAHQVGKDNAIIIANTSYTQLKVINVNVDLDIADVGWIYANDGGVGSTGTYCKAACPGFSSCNINNCPGTVKQGTHIDLNVSWVGGQSPYTLQLKRDGVNYGTPQTVVGNSAILSFDIDSSWTIATHALNLDITDSCSTMQACGTACNITVTPPNTLTTITITGCLSNTIPIGNTCQASASCLDQFGASMACGSLLWISSNSSVATVSPGGLITAVGPGSANITARSGAVTSNILPITVPPTSTLSSIIISGCDSALAVEGTCTLTASCLDQNNAPISCGTLAWISSNPAVVTVNNGIVTAVGLGTAIVFTRNATGTVVSNNKTINVTTTACNTPDCKVFMY